jgi:hypothetical protein
MHHEKLENKHPKMAKIRQKIFLYNKFLNDNNNKSCLAETHIFVFKSVENNRNDIMHIFSRYSTL